MTNTGNVTMTGIAVTDPNTPGISCPVTTLAPNESTTCTGTHTVVQADLDAGAVVNTASIVGTPPVGAPIPPVPSNQVTIPGLQSPALTIVKSSRPRRRTAVGQVIPYTFTVTNTGNVTITDVAVSDPKLGAVTCPVTTLAPGSSTVCTGSYTATAGDLDSGQPIVNTATVTGTPPPSAPALPLSSANTVTVTVVQSPALTIVKSSTTTSATAVGQVIPYTFTVTNTGNVTMTSVGERSEGRQRHLPADHHCRQRVDDVHGELHGDQADVTAGQVVNTASVVGTPPSGTPITAVVSNQAVIMVSPLPPDHAPCQPGRSRAGARGVPGRTDRVAPRTGGDAESMLRIAAVLAVLGAGLIMVSRRRKRFVS